MENEMETECRDCGFGAWLAYSILLNTIAI